MNNMLRQIIWLLPFLASAQLFGQDYYSFPARLQYVVHSFEAGNYSSCAKEAEILLSTNPEGRTDSLNYFAGRAQYMLGNPAVARLNFEQVSPDFSDYRFCRTFVAFQAYQLSEDAILETEQALLLNEPDPYKDYGLLLLGADLLNDVDTGAYRDFRQTHKPSELYVRKAFSQFDEAVDELAAQKRKKPLTAGLLSVVVPGAGKAYLGKWGTGALTLLGMGGLGIQAWEGYRKGGVKSPQFIVFSGLFAVFYVSNIYGSVTQAKAHNVQIVTDFKHRVGIQVNLSFDRLFTH